MNDFRQQMVVVWQELFFDGRQTATKNVNPDFVQLAEVSEGPSPNPYSKPL